MNEEKISLLETAPESSEPPAPIARRSKWRWVWLPVLLAVGMWAYFEWSRANVTSASLKGGPGRRGDAAAAVTPVVATKARRGNIGHYFNGLGNVTPIYTVTVKSRVDGQLMDVAYKEGDLVHQGDLLIQIDPRPFQVQLTQAEGQLAKDKAALDNARIDLARYETLLKQNATPEQQVATQRATVIQDEAAIQSDQGLVDSAKLNLTYCRITAPITGRVGLRLVDPGNIVHASDANGLVVITQIQPISVLFTIAEDQLPLVLQKMRAATLRVDVYDRDMKQKLAEGTLITVDNQIDQTTGTVRLRANFDNQDGALFPNQFVNARLLVEEKQGVILLPTAAIQRSSTSAYVYLVQPDSTVTIRNITEGITEGDQSEITAGLKAGDTVVMTGADKLQEGSKVIARVPGQREGARK